MLAIDPHLYRPSIPGIRKTLVFGTGGLVELGLDRPERQTLATRLAPRHIPHMRPLTAKQRAFCREYVQDENRRQAAISAGYREEAASERGGKLLRDQCDAERQGAGGRSRNRTGVAGFAVPCITTLLSGRT